MRSEEPGEIELTIFGMVNPSSYKRSELFKAVYTTDILGFQS